MSNCSPEGFSHRLQALIERGAKDVEFNAVIDDARLSLTPSNAATFLEAAVGQLAGAERPVPLAYSLGTIIRVFCERGDTANVAHYLEQLVDVTEKHRTVEAATIAAEAVREQLPGNVGADHVPHILKQVIRLHLSAGAPDKAIEVMLVAASLFADFGAFQTAYRTIEDAERLAHEHRLLKELNDVLMMLHSICLTEGDLPYAEKVWESLCDTFQKIDRPIPIQLALNRATALFWNEKLEASRGAFEEVLARPDIPDAVRAGTLPTLSACLRDLGERELSDAYMYEARELMALAKAVDPEHPLELELIATKNAIAAKKFAEASACLQRAVSWLDDAVDLVEKLHYRRGIRERYIPRIENLLVALPRTGQAADVFPIVAGTRSNRLSDWLHFLAWTEQLRVKLSESEIKELDALIASLAAHGSPHLMGYHEKYDDPMGMNMLPDPWRIVVEYADRVCAAHDVDRPFTKATSAHAAVQIKQRLDEGYALLVNLLTADKKALLIWGQRYILCDLPLEETVAFGRALYEHRQSPGQSKPLAVAVNAYQAALLGKLGSALDELAVSDCKGLLFLPDRMDLTPINLVMLGHEAIRKKMAAGLFSVSTCLAPFPARHDYTPPCVALGVLEGDSGLIYDRADLQALFDGSGAAGTIVDKPMWAELTSRMEHSDTLVLAHHGMSVGIFTDPTFADMGGAFQHTAMSLSQLQGATYLWPHRLVMLGTCHSGSLVNRNFQTTFKSHDLMGFPSVFLLNAQAEVVAASWAIIDRVAIMFTALFAPALREMRPAEATSRALARLIDLADEDLPALLSRVLPGDEAIQRAVPHMNNVRRQAYCYGAYQTYTLL